MRVAANFDNYVAYIMYVFLKEKVLQSAYQALSVVAERKREATLTSDTSQNLLPRAFRDLQYNGIPLKFGV